MWFDVEPVEAEFTEHSPFHIENEAIVRATPERLFDLWATGEGQAEWFKDFRACRWTSDEPHGVGSTREIELATLTVKERFLIWKRGERMTFHIYGITLPFVTAMVEDLRFTKLDGGMTRFTWRVHYRPVLLVRLIHPLFRWNFGKLFSTTCSEFAKYASTHP